MESSLSNKSNQSLNTSTQKVIHKGDECILKNNSQRSKWNVTGPGGLDMVVPSVSLIVPPPNPEAVDLSSKYVFIEFFVFIAFTSLKCSGILTVSHICIVIIY